MSRNEAKTKISTIARAYFHGRADAKAALFSKALGFAENSAVCRAGREVLCHRIDQTIYASDMSARLCYIRFKKRDQRRA
jgi:hypothetical protein